ncbi:MAG: hypothetical protein KGM15_13550 [Pseudomonadota bacterium]|nr:hypothetical protein [Pseudomonadota bacterium]
MSAVQIGEGIEARGFCEGASDYLAHEDWFHQKFRHWRGRSGRAYVFSVYPPQECPAYPDAVVIVAVRAGAPLACVDLGALPELRLGELRRLYGDRLDDVEFQVHVLAERQGDRRSLIADITPLAA